MALLQANQKQIAELSILDKYNKQVYLGNQYSVALNSQSVSGTSETDILLITNPLAIAGSKGLFHTLRKLAELTAAQTAFLRMYYAPTITSNGTPVTPTNLRPSIGANSIAKVYSSPTIAARGTFIDLLVAGPLTQNVSDLLLVVDPGASILITAQVSATASISAEIVWFEL